MLLGLLAGILTGAVACIAAGSPCPGVKAEPTDNGSLIRIRHSEAQPLTAFLVEIVDYPGNRFAYLGDELFREGIAAGEEKRIAVTSLMPGTVPDYLRMTAGVYKNGVTCGAPDKVKLIIDARRQNLQLTRDIIGRIEKSVSAREPRDNLIAQLAEWARAASPTSSAVITHAASELKRRTPEEALEALRTVERTLAASKPSL
jgi:hypothetical protein